MTVIKYAGRAMFGSVFTDDPQPRERKARLEWAVAHALEDARQWGDIVSEIVSINGRTLDNDEFHYCARMARQEA